MNDRGKVDAVCVGSSKGERKRPVESALFIEGYGIEGDAHAGKWHRQVSILDISDILDMKARGLPGLKSGDFAENLALSGLRLDDLGLGTVLKLGAEAELEVTQIGKVCHSRCSIYQQAGDCIMPSRGLFARVLGSGAVRAGDDAAVIRRVERSAFQCAVITVSDRCSKGEAEDTAGPAVADLVSGKLPANIYRMEIVPDDKVAIAERLKHYSDGHSIDLVCAIGGTGFAPRDVTPEAVESVIERATPGLDEVMRASSLLKTQRAMLSRAKSGIRQSTLIISLPGSRRAAVENMEAVMPALAHGLEKLRGDPSDCGRKE